MSNGMALDTGSVVSMVGASGWRAVYVGDGPLDVGTLPELVVPVIGWAVVVVSRSGWTVTTVVRPVVVMDGQMMVGLPEGWDLVGSQKAEVSAEG